MRVKIVEREVLPQHTHGCDWSAKRDVIVRKGNRVLFSRRGVSCSLGARGWGKTYVPTSRHLIEDDRYVTHIDLDTRSDDEPAERLTKKWFTARREKIDKFFGDGATDLIIDTYRPGKTLVLS